jgi:aldehyde dehydrogenase (NAD+)
MAAKGGGGKGEAWYSSTAEIDASIARVRGTFESGVTRDLAWRKRQLRAIRKMMGEHEEDVVAALAEDLGRPRSEALAGDYMATIAESDEALAHLDEWSEPQVVGTPLGHMFAHSEIRPEPYGVALIIGTGLGMGGGGWERGGGGFGCGR